MARVEMDFSGLDSFVEVLQRVPTVTEREARKMLSKGALNIKNRARQLAPRGPHTPHYENSINYDILEESGALVAEIGPAEGRRQRGLGNLLEYGSSHNDPHPHHEPALDEEEPRFYKAAEALAAEPFDG